MNAKIDISNVTLKTDRLILRPWALDDLDDFYEYAKVDGVGQMAGWLPHENKEKSLMILNMFIEEKKTFAIEYRSKVIGSLGIEEYDEGQLPEYKNKLGREIGYVLSKDYWGLGLMPEALKEVIRYCFEELELDFLACGHFIDNNQSKRVQEKCGFYHYKLVKHETRYGIVKDSWLSILENPINNKDIFNKDFYNISDDELELRLIDVYPANKGAIPFYWWNIYLKSKNVKIGSISFRIGHNYHSYYNGNIGYEIDEEYCGNNYACKACKMLIDVAKYHNMDKVYLSCDYDNIASYKTIEKLGGKLVEEVQPPLDYIFYYEEMPLHRIYELKIKL